MNRADFSIGTILYVVIAIVVAIVSAIQKNNKKADNAPIPKPAPKWEEEIDEEVEYKPEEYYRPVSVEEQHVEYDLFKPHVHDTLPKEKYAFGNETNVKTGTHIDEESENAFKKTHEEHETFHFDLKQAIIYSEIMNRKY